MKKKRLSKIFSDVRQKMTRQTKRPSFFIMAFLAGVLAESLISRRVFAFYVIALAFGFLLIFLILKKILPVATLAVFILGCFYLLLFSFLTSGKIAAGCSDVKIVSNPAERGTKTEFLVSNGNGAKTVVQTNEVQNFAYADIVNICFDQNSVQNLGMSDRRFYLSRYKTAYLVKNPKIAYVSQGKGIWRALYHLADFTGEKLQYLFRSNSGILAHGLVLGGTNGFTPDFINSLKTSGTTHLVAVSGYNVSIIIIVLFRFIRSVSSRRLGLIVSFVFLAGYCLMTGAGASVLRASLMGFLYLVSIILGRKNAITNALFVAALIMILLNPFALFDVGFQLSFMATYGLVSLAEPLKMLLFGKFQGDTVKTFTSAFSETLSAQIFTLPILLFSFGRLSLVAPLTNVLILPFVPFSMGLIALTFAGSLLFYFAGVFLAGLTQVLLDYFIFVIDYFGSLKFASFEIKGLNIIWALGLYVLIFLMTWLIKNKFKTLKSKL